MTGTPLDVRTSARAGDYLLVAGLALSGALTLQQPALVALAVPFVCALVFGLLLQRRPAISLQAVLTAERVVEGDGVELVVRLRSASGTWRGDVYVAEPATRLVLGPDAQRTVVRMSDDHDVELRFPVVTDTWGVYTYSAIDVVISGALDLVRYQHTWDPEALLRVLPGEERLRELARPRETTMTVGSRVTSARGEGFEFADIRPFVTGDRPRNVNWRATARAGELRVNQHHPERSTDVVLMFDGAPNEGLTGVVRATAALANAYLAERDRVGLVRFGAEVQWLTPGMGNRQLIRIVDAVIETSALFSPKRATVSTLPRSAFPRRALIIAVTGLPDFRATAVLSDAAAHGARMAVVEVVAEKFATAAPGSTGELALRLWQLEQEVVRDRLRDRGIPVVPWTPDEPLAAVLEEVATFQRYARYRAG
ncbi:MAG: DUF58 domain-containing protein [Mycobacteriales bacterium]